MVQEAQGAKSELLKLKEWMTLETKKYAVAPGTRLWDECLDRDLTLKATWEQWQKVFYLNSHGSSLDTIAAVMWILINDDNRWNLDSIKAELLKISKG